MATSQYTYHPFHTIGAATVLLWDASAGAWLPLGKAADASIFVSTEVASKDMAIKGLTQPIARRNRSKAYSITFRMLENANPLSLDLLFSEGAALGSAASGLIATSEVLRLYGQNYTELAHPYGIAQGLPGPVTDPEGSAGGSGGSIPPGTYYYWVVPVVEDPGKPGFEGEIAAAGPVEVTSGEEVAISFTPPTDYAPSKYRVYYNTLDSSAGATLAMDDIDSSPAVVSSHDDGPIYAAQELPLIYVYSYDMATLYEEGVDYTLDVDKGLIKRIAGGAINEGQKVIVVYAYSRPEGMVVPLGDPVELERYRRVKLLQLAPDSPDPSTWRETGVEFEFYKVNVAMNDTSYPFSEEDFSEGAAVTWDCLYDGSEAKVGTARTTSSVLADYA